MLQAAPEVAGPEGHGQAELDLMEFDQGRGAFFGRTARSLGSGFRVPQGFFLFGSRLKEDKWIVGRLGFGIVVSVFGVVSGTGSTVREGRDVLWLYVLRSALDFGDAQFRGVGWVLSLAVAATSTLDPEPSDHISSYSPKSPPGIPVRLWLPAPAVRHGSRSTACRQCLL